MEHISLHWISLSHFRRLIISLLARLCPLPSPHSENKTHARMPTHTQTHTARSHIQYHTRTYTHTHAHTMGWSVCLHHTWCLICVCVSVRCLAVVEEKGPGDPTFLIKKENKKRRKSRHTHTQISSSMYSNTHYKNRKKKTKPSETDVQALAFIIKKTLFNHN